ASAIAPTLVVLAVPWVLGRLVRERTRRAGAFRELALQTEREQAERERAAIAHERRLLGVLRRDEDPRALAPQPGLAQLGSLLAAVAGRGVHCELRTRGEPSG